MKVMMNLTSKYSSFQKLLIECFYARKHKRDVSILTQKPWHFPFPLNFFRARTHASIGRFL